MKKKTVFLDRDGTINIEKNYLYKREDFSFIQGAPEAVALLKNSGYRVIVVSNQAGVARGYYTEDDVKVLHEFVNEELKKWNTGIDAFYYCPHHPTAGKGKYKRECECRKPRTGLLERAVADFPTDMDLSWMIGDNKSDIEAGAAFGVRTILVRTGYGKQLELENYVGYDYIADDLYHAVKIVLANEHRSTRS